MSNLLLSADPVGVYTSGSQQVLGHVICDTVSDLPAPTDFTGQVLVMGSWADIIQTGDSYKMHSDGTWELQPAPTTTQLDLSGYYTSAETDTAIADALNTEMTTVFDHRYLRIGTGTAVSNGTDLDTMKTLGKYRNSSANNGCRNMPLEVAGRPFTLTVENMYGNVRYKQTLWLGQSGFVDRFYWRIMPNDTTWSDWYKVTGTAVQTDVPTP